MRVQGLTGVFRVLQACSGSCRRVQGLTGVFNSLTGVFRVLQVADPEQRQLRPVSAQP